MGNICRKVRKKRLGSCTERKLCLLDRRIIYKKLLKRLRRYFQEWEGRLYKTMDEISGNRRCRFGLLVFRKYIDPLGCLSGLLQHVHTISLVRLQPLLSGELFHSTLPIPELLCWHKVRFRMVQNLTWSLSSAIFCATSGKFTSVLQTSFSLSIAWKCWIRQKFSTEAAPRDFWKLVNMKLSCNNVCMHAC